MKSQRAKNLVDLMREIRKETFNRISYRCALRCNVSPAIREYVALESKTLMLNEIMQVLEDGRMDIVQLYGMVGLGRTTLVKELVWQEQRILVILDDVWGKLKLTQVDEDDSWELFEKKGGDSVKYPRVQPVAKKVAKSYDGLSLLIVNVVEAMKNQDLNAWKDALEQVTSFELEGYFYSSVRYAIELSYDHLENHELKIFFLLLGSMGKDCTTRDSLVSGWCLGLHKHVDTLANGRNRLYILIDNLRATSLLVDEGQRDLVVALDVVRQVAASISSRDKPFFTV
ncbi:hypothetical protein JHK87_033762 [Glycine soja]|nr:hypothetical protein JHK87_033762 [Glycine soja]